MSEAGRRPLVHASASAWGRHRTSLSPLMKSSGAGKPRSGASCTARPLVTANAAFGWMMPLGHITEYQLIVHLWTCENGDGGPYQTM